MTVLFWPRHDDEPLPNTAGVIVGWHHDKDTVIVAKILHHKDHSLVQTILKQTPREHNSLQLIGKWDPSNLKKSWPHDDLPTMCPTSSGPWYANKNKTEQDDLLVYYEPCRIYGFATSDGETTGFASILQRLNQVDTIVERLKIEGEGDKEPVSTTADIPAPEKQSSNDTISFLRRHSLLYNHFQQSTTVLDRIPLVQLLFGSRNVDDSSDRIKICLDLLLGVFVCVLIFAYSDKLLLALEFGLNSDQHLRTAILWLESFPVGFKLNVPLTRNMGRQLLLLVDYWHHHVLGVLLGTVEKRQLLHQILAITSLVFGNTTLKALLVDLVQLATIHVTIIHAFFAKIHQFQLFMLDSLWKLFRGKKHNPLRKRTDSMEYDSMQLLVGILAFTFVLFLFTTILVYHVFFGLLFIVIQPTGLWLLYEFLRSFPFADLWKRWRYPSQMGVGIYLEEQQHSTVCCLRVIPKSYTAVLAEFSKPGRVCQIMLASLGKLATGQRIAVLRDCISP